MAANETPARADAPREAVACWMIPARAFRAVSVYPEDGTAKPVVETDVPALAIDNGTGGGLVARVRADFDKIAWDDIEATYHEMGHDKFVQKMTERVCKALGVQL